MILSLTASLLQGTVNENLTEMFEYETIIVTDSAARWLAFWIFKVSIWTHNDLEIKISDDSCLQGSSRPPRSFVSIQRSHD